MVGGTVLFDVRWEGAHGIGRFARELRSRLPVEPFSPERDRLGALEPLRLGQDLRRRSPRFFFSPGFAAIVGYDGPFAVTVHDLIHLETVERSIAKRFYYDRLLAPTLRRASFVCTVSEFSKARILDWLDMDPDRVRVVGNGVSDGCRPDGESFDWRRRYVLYVGNDKPHKNLEVLFQASKRTVSRRHGTCC